MLATVIQVKPTSDFKVYVYFADGKIKLFDVRPLIDKGGVFQQIADVQDFIEMCTVMNGTLAWDVAGNFNDEKCIDIDPETIYSAGKDVSDPMETEVA
ncbi:MAG: DUF2442 domain-containing protein [Bdellovibrionaceae bacterium]|nr:DUF2442 domain-containing protein [Pseudobdellovibrionaceae bacterium]